jgi:Short C-terminal domain
MATPEGADETAIDALRAEQSHPGELTVDVAAELVKLAEQHAQGTISDADFDAARSRLLAT